MTPTTMALCCSYRHLLTDVPKRNDLVISRQNSAGSLG